MTALNSNQLAAVNHLEGPLLVLAGAGSGKTKVVTQRIIRLINLGVSPNSILALTFTNKAANEMKQRIEQETKLKIPISTFHSLGAKILREIAAHANLKQNFNIYDPEESQKVLKEVLLNLNIHPDKEKINGFQNILTRIKDELTYPESEFFKKKFSKTDSDVFLHYQLFLSKVNAVDFDDLLYLPIKIMDETVEIRKHYQTKWQFLLIDEYQDTNYSQYYFSKMLSAKHQNICVVGDPDQSIYSFRGAKYQNLLNFDKDFPSAKIIKLEHNYRSTNTILEASNALIKNNLNRFEKKLFSTLGHGQKIQLFEADTEKEEATFVATKINELKKKNHSLETITIFYRTNAQSRLLEDALLCDNIPYIIYGGISFYQRKEIKDILAFLKLIENESDFFAFTRITSFMKTGIGAATQTKLLHLYQSSQKNFFELCIELIESKTDHAKFLSQKQKEALAQIIFTLRNLKRENLPLDQLICKILEKFNYFNLLDDPKEKIEERRENINELIAKASENSISLSSFLEEITLVYQSNENVNQPAVQLMTLHNSKGLEFDIVFIVGLEEDLLPHINCKLKVEEIEEERRLLYVGMTRAKKALFLTYARLRLTWNNLKRALPSRFLKELPFEYLQRSSSTCAYFEKKDDSPALNNFEKVEHSVFGIGEIVKVYTSSFGETFDIIFEDKIKRTLVAKYAKLKKI